MTSQLRAALDDAFAALPQRLLVAGEGDAACRTLSDIYDRELATRFLLACAGLRTPLALVATGGWARRELAPYSDIDFIVLHTGDETAAKQVADRLLYPLWDDKLAVGHALREPKAVAKLAREDLATATALLDARHVAGARELTGELLRATQSVVAGADLAGMLADEQRARHARFGASLYLLEPNTKQGIGGLRDLATALWAAMVRWPPAHGATPRELIAGLAAGGQLTYRQARVLDAARDFQLRVRALVQLAAKRRFDQLTFEIQEAIGPRLYPAATEILRGSPAGFAGRGAEPWQVALAVAPAVEQLMQQYYVHARGVLGVTERLLELARTPGKKKPKVERVDDTFDRVDGELVVRDPDSVRARPSEMVRAFRVAVEQGIPLAGATRELIADQIARDPAPLAADPLAARLVLEALADPRDTAQPSAFELMHRAGILSAVMPEWAPCTARVQHDLYHVYTVDQHQLYALAMQKQLARRELAAAHPLATELWRTLARPIPLYLGTLLHDVGKPLGKGHAEKGAVLAGAVARRLGLSEPDAELASMLVRQHLTMSHLSQKRDLGDPEVIARFAEKIGTEEQLAQLYLLTLCDTAMTAPDNLTAWKSDLLGELVMRTRAALGSGPDGTGLPRPGSAAEGQCGWIDPVQAGQLAPEQAVRVDHLLATARGKQPPIALDVRCVPSRGHSEVAIVAPDAPGVLAAIAGALTASRVDVLGAVLGAAQLGEGRVVADVFYVRDGKGAAIPEDDPRWPRLATDLRALLAGEATVTDLLARRRPASGLPPRVTPGVATEIRFAAADDSSHATIVEVTTRDRMGVLHAITAALAASGLDISLAKVATEGEKVSDVFYVTRGGDKLTGEPARAALVARLHAALEALDP
jgi:[protein-PII] uridylyltransferase